MNIAKGSQEIIRVNREFSWEDEEGGKAMETWSLCLLDKQFVYIIMLYQFSRHTPSHPQTSVLSDEHMNRQLKLVIIE